MSEAEKAIWTAIHHYESVYKTNRAEYAKEALLGLRKALDEIKKYEELKEKYFK